MALLYLVEFVVNDVDNLPRGEAAFFHLDQDPGESVYLDEISGERFERFGIINSLASSLFAIAGTGDLAISAYRIYITKSPVFEWEEPNGIIEKASNVLKNFFGESVATEVSGSRRMVNWSIRRNAAPLTISE